MAKRKRTEQGEIAECFEDSLAELESIVGQLESGALSLSDAIARYEQGVKHLKTCQKILERAERRIELLSGVDAGGNPITQPFDDEAIDSLEEKANARGRRRTSNPKRPTGKTGVSGKNVDDAGRLF
jgi:exodeoxyribonuclease VII small subunit